MISIRERFVNKRQLRKIIDQTNRMQCDYVLIAGDTFDVDAFDYCNLSEIAEELQRLKAVKGVYAILGTMILFLQMPE